MKKIIFLIFILIGADSKSFAGVVSSSRGNMVLGLSGLVGIAASSNAAKQVTAGLGGEFFLGYAFDKQFSLGLVSGYDSYGLSTDYILNQIGLGSLPAGISLSGNLSYVPLLLQIKYAFGTDKVRPFGIIGVGAAFNGGAFTVSSPYGSVTGSISEADLLLRPGLGLAFTLSDKADFFFQGSVDINFTSDTNTTPFILTVTPGGTLTGTSSISGDNPTIAIPFQAGVNFNL